MLFTRFSLNDLNVCAFILMSLCQFMLASSAFAQKPAQAIEPVVIDLQDNSRNRPVKIFAWYRQETTCPDALICPAKNAPDKPVILISHGSMGSAAEYTWLGSALANAGYLVIAVNHYGESWIYGERARQPETVYQLWWRPEDLSFVMDAMEKKLEVDGKPLVAKNFHHTGFIALGHSSGGSTALLLAGARYNTALAETYCSYTAPDVDKSCRYRPTTLSTSPNSPGAEYVKRMGRDYHDVRVTGAILLDPGVGYLTTASSLEAVTIPTLLIAPVNNDFLNYPAHAGYYAQHLQHNRLVKLSHGEGHFVFLQSCEHTFEVHGVPLCRDREGVDRESVHRQVVNSVLEFLQS